MLKSILKTNEALSAALYEENYTSYVLSSNQLTYIEEACEILEYFEQVTIRISGEKYGTSALTIPSILLLLNITSENQDDSDFKKTFKAVIHNKIKFYNQKYQLLNNDNLALASFTNPFYKKFTKGIGDERKDLIQRASKCVEDYYLTNVDKFKTPQSHAITEDDHINSKKLVTLSDDSDSENGELNIRLVRKEIKNYINLPKPDSKINVIDYWKQNKEKFPVIYDIFLQHHFVPGSSTSSERNFSDCGEQIWDRRNRISTETVEAIMFLYENHESL